MFRDVVVRHILRGPLCSYRDFQVATYWKSCLIIHDICDLKVTLHSPKRTY
jgi:hypothetical protein